MSFRVFHAVLQFSVYRLVKFFDDLRARGSRPRIVRFDVLHKHRQHLRSESKFRRVPISGSRIGEHEPRIAKVHLRSGNGITVSIMLDKAKSGAEPIDRVRQVFVLNVGQDCIDRHGMVSQHDSP